MARPKLEIDADQVYKLAQHGCTVEEIADFFGCSRETIHGRFSTELAKGKAELRIGLRNWQIAAAKKGNVVMQIWLGKNWLKQTDKIETEHSGEIKTIVIDADDAEF